MMISKKQIEILREKQFNLLLIENEIEGLYSKDAIIKPGLSRII